MQNLRALVLKKDPGISKLLEYYGEATPSSLNAKRLFTEVCWIVYCSGFRYNVVRKFWPSITKAFYGFDVYRVVEESHETYDAALRICEVSGFRNRSKAAWCVENARRILPLENEWVDQGGIRGFFEHLSNQKVSSLVQRAPALVQELGFKGIGRITIFHLMKNVGIDIFKPDIHVRRLLTDMKLISNEKADPEEICEAMTFLSTSSGYKISQVDTLLFAYGITIGDRVPTLLV